MLAPLFAKEVVDNCLLPTFYERRPDIKWLPPDKENVLEARAGNRRLRALGVRFKGKFEGRPHVQQAVLPDGWRIEIDDISAENDLASLISAHLINDENVLVAHMIYFYTDGLFARTEIVDW